MKFRKVIGSSLKKSPVTQNMVNKAYRFFPIANVNGSLTSRRGWTGRLSAPPKLQIDELGRTCLTLTDEGPSYLVSNGTDREFRKLSKSSGFRVDGGNSARVSASIDTDKDQRAQIVLLEFDGQRNRIGQASVPSSTDCLIYFNSETKYVLPTVRVVGPGTLTVNWLRFDAQVSKRPDGGEKVQFVEKMEIPSNSPLAGIKAQLETASRGLRRVKSELHELEVNGRGILNETNGAAASNLPTLKFRERLLHETLAELAMALDDSNGSYHYSPVPGRVGIITDEYMYNFYRDAFEEVVYLSPDNYEGVLKERPVDLILYITCWKGLENEEWKGVKFRERPANALDGILSWAKKHQVPTFFQSIEDPSNFEYFLPIAAKFDYVFTSDTDMIAEYKNELGHNRVYYGEYGANPRINNPIGSWRFNFNRAFFAGSYPERYQERVKDMKTVFNSIPDRSTQLLVLDRNYYAEGLDFPEEYQESIIGPVGHVVLQKMHKLFRYSLNFNSIKSSPTMCAMRVYELQAQGLPIISNYAKSVFNRFPEIRVIPEPTKIEELNDSARDFHELKIANDLLVNLQNQKNCYEVASSMVEKAGFDRAPSRNSKILVFVSGRDAEEREIGIEQQGVEVVYAASKEEFKRLALTGTFDYAAAMSRGYEYDPKYLYSRMAAFVYADVEFVTQDATFVDGTYVDGVVHEYAKVADDRFLTLVALTAPGAVDFLVGEKDSLNGVGYFADPFGVGYNSYVVSQSAKDESAAAQLTIIIPVYNNGKFLEHKCFESIRRNSRWRAFKILLVDDGSTDRETIDVCRKLESLYPNVDYFSFGDGGSGSASRPRNKGVELATTEFVTFLDPDNEISVQGYDRLLTRIENGNESVGKVDFVSGYQVKVAETVGYTGRHAGKRERQVTDSTKEFFRRGKFPVVSTQASVIRRSMLIQNGIKFVEGAAGQDTLYGWEVLHYANNPVFVDDAYIIYYAERDDSVTNTVDQSYFGKSLVLERAQVSALKEMGIYEYYLENHFDSFMRNWYIPRLARVADEQRGEAEESLRGIVKLYGQEPSDYMGEGH